MHPFNSKTLWRNRCASHCAMVAPNPYQLAYVQVELEGGGTRSCYETETPQTPADTDTTQWLGRHALRHNQDTDIKPYTSCVSCIHSRHSSLELGGQISTITYAAAYGSRVGAYLKQVTRCVAGGGGLVVGLLGSLIMPRKESRVVAPAKKSICMLYVSSKRAGISGEG